MQGRSSSEEAAFDDDASDYSSSGNDSDIVRAISADILRNGESIRCLGLGLQPASAPQGTAARAPQTAYTTVSVTPRGTMDASV